MVYIFYVMLELGVTYAFFKNLTNVKLSSFFQLVLIFVLYNILLREVVHTEAIPFLTPKAYALPFTLCHAVALIYFYNFLRSKYVRVTR